jgi:hypothetical protein
VWAAAQALCAGQSLDAALVTSRQEIGEFYRAIVANNGDELSLMKGLAQRSARRTAAES